LINSELERMWKEAVFAYLDHYPEICLEGLRKTTKNPRYTTVATWTNSAFGFYMTIRQQEKLMLRNHLEDVIKTERTC
jgi:hypothetical protein